MIFASNNLFKQKKMNKIRLTAMAVLAASAMNTQTVMAQEKPIQFGIKAGVNLPSLSGDGKDFKSTIRYQFGVTADIALNNKMYVLTGLNFQNKVLKEESYKEEKLKMGLTYIQLPAHLTYKLALNDDVNLFVGAGPYIAYGIGGKTKGQQIDEKTFDSARLKKLDYGAGATAVLAFGKLGFGAGYDIGLNNISAPKGTKLRSRTAYITIGYKF